MSVYSARFDPIEGNALLLNQKSTRQDKKTHFFSYIYLMY